MLSAAKTLAEEPSSLMVTMPLAPEGLVTPPVTVPVAMEKASRSGAVLSKTESWVMVVRRRTEVEPAAMETPAAADVQEVPLKNSREEPESEPTVAVPLVRIGEKEIAALEVLSRET